MGWLRSQPGIQKVAIVGFSAGGHLAYLAACLLPLDRAAVLYAGWLPTTDIPMSQPAPTLDLTPGLTGRLLFLVGEDDALIDAGQRDLIRKALAEAGGGHVPVGALLTRKNIFDKIFNQMDRAVVHGSTFAKNDLAMAAGIATLEVLEAEKLIEAAAKRGAELRLALTRLVPGYELMKEVRGKGLMIGVEFGPPKSLRLKASWNVLETASKGLFCQLITVPLFKDHKILTQVSGHGSHTIKLLPPLVITDEDCSWIEKAFDTVIASSHKVPGAIWSLGKTLVDNAVRKSA